MTHALEIDARKDENRKFSGGPLSSSLTHQLALIFRLSVSREEKGDELDPPTLLVDVPNIKQQRELTDCGVFAIAFAIYLALGDDVTKLSYHS